MSSPHIPDQPPRRRDPDESNESQSGGSRLQRVMLVGGVALFVAALLMTLGLPGANLGAGVGPGDAVDDIAPPALETDDRDESEADADSGDDDGTDVGPTETGDSESGADTGDTDAGADASETNDNDTDADSDSESEPIIESNTDTDADEADDANEPEETDEAEDDDTVSDMELEDATHSEETDDADEGDDSTDAAGDEESESESESDDSEYGEHTLTVTVADSETGDPIEGATVEATGVTVGEYQAAGTTGEHGVVELETEDDDYDVVVSAEGYEDSSAVAPMDQDRSGTAELEPADSDE